MSELVLLVFVIPGSLTLSFAEALRNLKVDMGIDLDGFRLVVFCLLGAVVLLSRGKVENSFHVYFIFLGLCAVSLVYTSDILEGIRFFAKLLVPYLVFMLARESTDIGLERMRRGFFIVALLHMPFVFETLFKWFGTIDPSRDIPRAMGLSGGRVIFGTFMVFIFVLLYYRPNRLSGRDRRIYLIGSMFALFAVFLSGARIAWLALLVSVLVLGVVKNWKVAFFIGIIFLIMIIMFHPLLQQRLGIVFSEGKITITGAGAGTASDRLITWKTVLSQGDRSHWIIWGHGLGSSKRLLAFARHFDYPHNEYIRILLEVGISGLFLFLFAFFYLSTSLVRKYKNKLLLLPIAVFLIMCLADNTLNNYFENGAIFAFLLVYIGRTTTGTDLSDE